MDQSVDPGEAADGPETAESAPAAPELAGPVSEESAELYFLIANFLTNASQCSRAAAVLRQELREKNLLGTAYNWEGHARPASFDDVQRRHQALPADQLARITAQYLRQQQAVAAATDTSTCGGGGGSGDAVAGGSSSGTAIVVQEQPPPLTGPGVSRSLLSRVEPFSEDREANERARARCAARVVEACIESVRVRASARKVYSDLATVKSKLEALELDAAREARAIASAAGSATRGRCRAALVPGQESQAELTRLALRRQREELLAREVVLPEEVTLAEDEKDAALAEARQRGAMHNSLTRYAGKAVPTILSNRRAGGARFGGGRIAGRVPLRGASSRLLDDRMRPLITANGHGVHPVFCIKFDRTGQYIFTGADDALVKVWSVTSGRLLLCLRGHASVITDMDVSPDNSMLVTSSDDRNMRVWDPRTGATLTVLRGHTAAVNLVRFAPGDSVAMSASEDGTCRVWDLRGQDSLAMEDVVPIVLPHTNEQGAMIPVMCLSVSPAGNLIAAGCIDGAVRVWAYGDSDDDAAWGTGKHNTRRTGRDTIGRGEVYRSEAPRRSIPSTVAAAAAAAAAATTVPVPVASGDRAQAEVPPAVPPPAVIPPDAVSEGGATAAVAFGLARGESGGANGAAAAAAAGGGGSSALQPQLAPWGGGSGVSTAVNGPWGGVLGPGQAPPPPRPPPPPAPPAAVGEGRERRGRSANRGSGSRGGDGDGGVLEVRLATKLFGHVSGITDARFSGLGDRILTASMEDGTARVYSWGPRFSNVKHVVLKVCRQDTAAAGRARGGGRARAGGAGKKSTLDDACWSCDDDIIVTTEKAPALTGAAASRSQEEATSQFKVWSSETGALLHTVKDAHANTVSALIPHPYDPRRLASVGAEGTVCTWDVGRRGGRRVRAFENILAAGPQSEQLHHGMSVAVLDGVFSPDGNSIAVADVVGRWTLYGTGHRTDETVAGKKVPLEQYFTSDYRELLRDERHNVVDAFTQQPPHLAQTGLLVDHIGNAYPEDTQPNTSELKGPLPLAPGVVTQRLRAVQAIAADLAKALAAKEARSSNARGVGVPQHLSNGAGGARRWQEVQEADAAAKAIAGGGGGGSRRKGGSGGSGAAAAAAGGGGTWSGGRSRGGATARQRGFYTDPGEDEIYLDVSDEDGDYDAEDPDSEYDDAPRGRRAGGGGGSRRRANEPLSREERARRRQQALLERTAGSGSGSGARSRAGARGRGAGRNNSGGVVSSLSSDEEEEEDVEEDEDDMDEGGAGSRSSGRRGGGKRKGKGKGRARGRRGGGGSGSGELPIIPDEFNQSVVAADSDEEIEQWPTGVEATGPGGRSTRGADRAAAEAAIAAAGGVLKVDRGTLKCALCHGGHTRERPLPGKIVGPHPLMDGASQLWVHDWCALYSPMVCRDDRTDALCNITSEKHQLSGTSVHLMPRFDLIDSSYLADNLGILNVVMATSPLLKPCPHAVVRTDLRRSGPARKRLTRAKDVEAAIAAQAEAEKSVEGLDAKGNKKKMKKKETKMAAAAYAALTDEDWCTTKVQECALLLGVVPVSGVAPAVGHFHTMLEAARAAKTNKKNADIGDLGQRLRLAWKQVCLIDQRAGAFVASKDRVATTLHPRVDLSPEEFADMMLPFWLFMTRSLYVEAANCPKVLEGGQQQLRVSPYTPASFARLLSHSLRFLKFDAAHTRELVEHLHRNYSTGLFDSNVVDQLDVHMHLLSLFRTEAMGAADVVRWALDCPWWDKKPSAEGIVPKGSPGMCRVVMLAPEEAVSIVRHLRNPALCILMNDESQNVKTLVSTLHCCFVRVNRGSGPFPPEDKEGEPWYVLRERSLRVKETVPDDPEAELMVSFLLGSTTLIPAKANQIELELRLQDSAARDAAPASVAKSLETAEGVIFRTNLGERGETAVVFPNKRNTATILERWLPQSSERYLLLQDDNGVEPGLGQRRVGKMNRYIIAPGRPELYLPTGPLRKKSDWASNIIEVDEEGEGRYMGYTLNMVNPAARALLADKQTETTINVLPPCGVEIIMHAPEKKDGGKGKKKRKGTSEDLSRGGVDGGLRFLAILPFPVESAYDGGGGSDELFVIVHTYEDHMLNPFVNVLQTSRADGAKLSRPLLSNWSFPVRSVADGRRLKVCEATKEYVHNMDLWLFEHGPLENMPLLHYHSLCRHMMSKFMSDGVKALEDGGVGAGGGQSPTGRYWHLVKVGYRASRTADAFFESVGPEMDKGVYVTVHVEDILVDEGNESLLLDVTLCLWDSQLPADFFAAENGPSALATALARGCEIVVPFLDQLLPMAVERGRRTYCHRHDCRYLATTNSGGAGWGGRGGDGKGKDDPPLCLCAAGKDVSPSLVKGLRDSGRAEVLPRLYHAVLPTLIAVDDVEGFRLKSNALVDGEGGDRGAFAHLKKPVEQSSGAMLSYNGPIRGVGNIVESVPVTAVQERGGGVANQPLGSVSPSAANAFGEVEGNDSGYANGKPSSTAVSSAKTDSLVGVDEETRRVLAKAGLGRMPATTLEWVKFERVQQGLPADRPCPVCLKPSAQKRCSRCKIVKYCSRECQKEHWLTHKLECYADG